MSTIADIFEDSWTSNGNSICTTVSYSESMADYNSVAQTVNDSSCDSVVLISYLDDGASIIEELDALGWAGQIFGDAGISSIDLTGLLDDESLADGIITLSPLFGEQGTYESQRSTDFWKPARTAPLAPMAYSRPRCMTQFRSSVRHSYYLNSLMRL